MKNTTLALVIIAAFPPALFQLAHAQSAATPQAIEAVEVRGAFLGAGSKSAMKLDVPVRDTPFSVSSYTGPFIKAIETTQVADLYNYMNGVKRAGNTGYDLNVRGFSTSATDRNAILVATVGRGRVIYTSLALQRQIANGVPGAMRLLVNLLSAGLPIESRLATNNP